MKAHSLQLSCPLKSEGPHFNLELINLQSVPNRLSAYFQDYQDILVDFKSWVLDFISKSHPQLGRPGPICPYTKRSIELGRFWVAVEPGWPSSLEEVTEGIYELKEQFQALNVSEDSDVIFNTLTILYVGIDPRDHGKIEEVQKKLKPDFVKDGLMIGQFFPGCAEPGAYNRSFHPLNSQLPMLVFRNMTSKDMPFLEGDAAFEAAHRERFGKCLRKR